MALGDNDAAKANDELAFCHFKTDSTYAPDDLEELLPFDNDSDDEDSFVMGHRFGNTSFPRVALNGMRLNGKLLEECAHDKSPWASPMGATDFGASFGDLGNYEEQAHEPSKVVLSIGSELHGTGDCKPCAWFWKPQGCQNGRECLHCHLCPKSEVKARKKTKARDRKAAQVEEDAKDVAAGEFRPPPGLTQLGPPLLEDSPPGLFMEFGPSDHQETSEESTKLFLDAGSEATTEEGNFEVPEVPSSPDSVEQNVSYEQQEVAIEETSLGSALHLSGACKPCAWFWKPQGCANGADCLHCHICPKGEVKRRKKQKKAAAQEDEDDEEDELDQVAEPTMAPNMAVSFHLQAQQLLIQQQQEQLMQMQFQLRLQEQHMQLLAQRQAALANTATMAPAPLLVSKGSATHYSGDCKPCAWVWKNQGCENGQDCEYCHMCQPGEAKLRKKAKEAQKTLQPSMVEA